jgi:hypothetical protein
MFYSVNLLLVSLRVNLGLCGIQICVCVSVWKTERERERERDSTQKKYQSCTKVASSFPLCLLKMLLLWVNPLFWPFTGGTRTSLKSHNNRGPGPSSEPWSSEFQGSLTRSYCWNVKIDMFAGKGSAQSPSVQNAACDLAALPIDTVFWRKAGLPNNLHIFGHKGQLEAFGVSLG